MLATGSYLDRYRILEHLDSGAMGNIYKAQDEKLDRLVAIKTLSDALDQNTQSFLNSEAVAIAQLSHPNICAIFDIGYSQGLSYFVMEYLQGTTLTTLIKDGRLDVDDALLISIQMADALDQAHQRGVVHCDFKPANILCTDEGSKLLDFGVARMSNQNNGHLGGSLAYMAPEQLENSTPDTRTDIYAFGCVLYEMLTGQVVFRAESSTRLTANILTQSAPLPSKLRPELGTGFDHVISNCLAKDPDERWQSASDLLRELEWIGTEEKVKINRRPLAQNTMALIGLSCLLLLSSALIWNEFSSSSDNTYVVDIVLDENALENSISLSPDGKQLAYISSKNKEDEIWIRSIRDGQIKKIPGTKGARSLFWSPASNKLGFFTATELKTVELERGAPRTLAQVNIGRDGSWNEHDEILFSRQSFGGLYLAGGRNRDMLPITRLDADENSHRSPTWLPGGKTFLFLRRTTRASYIHLGSLNSNESISLLRSDSKPLFMANTPWFPSMVPDSGWILYISGSTLLAHEIDLKSKSLVDAPITIVEGVPTNSLISDASFTVADDGTLTYLAEHKSGSTIVAMDRSGNELRSLPGPYEYGHIDLSPDGRQIVAQRMDKSEIWLVDVQSNVHKVITPAGGFPIWQRNSGAFVYLNDYRFDGGSIIGTHSLSALSPQLYSFANVLPLFPGDLENDKYVWVSESNPKANHNLGYIDLSQQTYHKYRTSKYSERTPRIDPKGRWLSYESNESGRFEIYVQRRSEKAGAIAVSDAGGMKPLWHPKGDELYYLSLDGNLKVIETKTNRIEEFSVPKVLFDARPKYAGIHHRSVVTVDGQTFYIIRRAVPAKKNLTLHTGWHPKG